MGKEKNAKTDATIKTVTETVKSTKAKIAILAVLVIVVLNIFWTMTGRKIAGEIQTVRSEIAALAVRLDSTAKAVEKESAMTDLDSVKADMAILQNTLNISTETIQKAGEDFDAKLNAIVKSEEAKLEVLAKAAEAQKAYVEELKSLLAGETGK